MRPALGEFLRSSKTAMRDPYQTLGVSKDASAADIKKLAAVAKAAPIRFICLDVANGYAEKFLETVKRVRDDYPHAVIMAGNVVTGRVAAIDVHDSLLRSSGRLLEVIGLDDLVVVDARIDGGPMFKRIRPRARGMAFGIKRRMSHIRVALE